MSLKKSPMNDELTTIGVNPYQSPLAAGQEANDRAEIKYPSARTAFLAGARRGAMFGGKWMALILGSILIVVCVAMTAMTIFIIYHRPNDTPRGFLDLLEFFGLCIFAFVSATSFTAGISAIMMGIGEIGCHCRAKKKATTTTIH
jgi:hypothetical protein